MIDVSSTAAVAAVLVRIGGSAAAQTTNTLLSVIQSGVTTGFTGNAVTFVGSSTTGAGNVVNITAVNTTAGGALNIANNALTTGYGARITHTTSVIAAGGSLFRVSSTSIDTSTTTGTLVDLSSTASTAGTLMKITDTGLLTGIGLHISHTTGVLASGASLLRLASTARPCGNSSNDSRTLSDRLCDAYDGYRSQHDTQRSHNRFWSHHLVVVD